MLAMLLQLDILFVFDYLQHDDFLLTCFVLHHLGLSHVPCSGSIFAIALKSDGGSLNSIHSLPNTILIAVVFTHSLLLLNLVANVLIHWCRDSHVWKLN
jgi:hypothetical protein